MAARCSQSTRDGSPRQDSVESSLVPGGASDNSAEVAGRRAIEMKKFRDLAIGRKLTLVMMSISSATVLLAGITVIIYEVAAFRTVAVHDLSVQAEIVGENCAAALAFDDPRTAQETLASLRARTDIVAACVYRNDGSILASYPSETGASSVMLAEPEPDGHRLEHGNLVLFHQVVHGRKVLGTVYLRSNLGPHYTRLMADVIIAVATMLVSWILALALAARLQRVISEPILDLAQVARNVTERQDYSLRAEKHGEDELGVLTTGFNRMLEDIQERDSKLQQAYGELRQSEQRFRQFAEAVSQVFWMTDPDKHETLYVSPGYEAIWGRTCASLYETPQSRIEAVHPQDQERVRHALSALRNGGAYGEEYRVVRPDGSIRWVRDRAFPVRDASGKLVRLAGIAEDVTERKVAEAAILRQAELLDLAREGIYVRDIPGTITLWNHGAEQMYGWTRQEAEGHLSHELLHTAFPKPVSEIEEDLLRVGYWNGELTHTRRDGRQLVVESRWALSRDERGRPVEILVINNDITERKQADETLRQFSVRLQQAQDQERRRIARELHDSTGQNLAALSMNLSLIGQSADTLGASARKALAESMTTVEGCIREIRTLSYLLHPPMLDERGLAPALRWFVEGFSKRSGMKVDLEVASDWERLAPDEEIAIFRVVQESLANAHRHAHSSTAKIRLNGDETAIRLEVQDAGTGLPDGGWRVAWGVGITGMQERIKQLGGQLQIESGNEGTTVRVTLPLGRKTP